MNPRVSVVIRAWRAEKYISAAVESVLSQDYDGEIELVICCDKTSKDNTLEILARYILNRTQNRYIKLIKHSQASPFRTLTRYGLPNVTGEYVTFLDYDNKFPPTYIRKVVEFSVRNNSRFIFTRASLIDSGGQRLGRNLYNVPNDYADLKRLVMRNYVDTNTMAFHSDVLKGLLPELRLLDSEFYDWIWEDWLLALLALNPSVSYVADVEMEYRVHQSNIAHSVHIGISRDLHIRNLEKDFRTLTAFKNLRWNKLALSQKLYLHLALLEKLILVCLLKHFTPERSFPFVYKAFALIVQILERSI